MDLLTAVKQRKRLEILKAVQECHFAQKIITRSLATKKEIKDKDTKLSKFIAKLDKYMRGFLKLMVEENRYVEGCVLISDIRKEFKKLQTEIEEFRIEIYKLDKLVELKQIELKRLTRRINVVRKRVDDLVVTDSAQMRVPTLHRLKTRLRHVEEKFRKLNNESQEMKFLSKLLKIVKMFKKIMIQQFELQPTSES